MSPFAVVVRNGGEGPVNTHALISDPKRAVLIKAFQHASDQNGTISVMRWRAGSRSSA
jgi:hypothetical protein